MQEADRKAAATISCGDQGTLQKGQLMARHGNILHQKRTQVIEDMERRHRREVANLQQALQRGERSSSPTAQVSVLVTHFIREVRTLFAAEGASASILEHRSCELDPTTEQSGDSPYK